MFVFSLVQCRECQGWHLMFGAEMVVTVDTSEQGLDLAMGLVICCQKDLESALSDMALLHIDRKLGLKLYTTFSGGPGVVQ